MALLSIFELMNGLNLDLKIQGFMKLVINKLNLMNTEPANSLSSLPSELQNPLLSFSPTQNKSRYNPLLYPPDIEKAKLHGKACRISKPIPIDPLKATQDDLCECCKKNLHTELLPLGCDLKHFNVFRFGVPLYFHVLKSSIYMLLFLFCIFGLCSVFTNLAGDSLLSGIDQTDETDAELIQAHNITNKSDFTDRAEDQLSTLAVLSDEIVMILQTVLIIIVLLGYAVLFHYFKDEQADIIQDCQQDYVSPSDYAIEITGLEGTCVSDPEVRDFLMTNHGIDPSTIQKIVLIHDIKELTELSRKREELVQKRHKKCEIPTKASKMKQESKIMKIQRIDSQLQEIQSKRAELVKNHLQDPEAYKFSGSVIVILNNITDVRTLIKKWKIGLLRWAFINIASICGFYNNYKLKGRLVQILPMPDPNDLYWENMGISKFTKAFRVVMMTLLAFLIMLIGFFIEFFLINRTLQLEELGEASTSLIVIKTVVVTLINIILSKSIIRFTVVERHRSHTDYYQSIAQKIILQQFINTAIVSSLVHVIGDLFYTSTRVFEDILQAMTFQFISNAFVGTFFVLFDFSYFYKLCLRRNLQATPWWSTLCCFNIENPEWLRKFFKFFQCKDRKVLQAEANTLFEGSEFKVAESYAFVVNTIFLTAAYAPMIPICIPISIVGLILRYWVDKYLFLRRHTSPLLMAKMMTKTMAKYIQVAPFFLATGSLIINAFAYGQNYQTTLTSLIISGVGIVISLLSEFLPIRSMIKKLRKHKPVSKSADFLYDDVKYRFPISYESADPISRAALEDEQLTAHINKLEEESSNMGLDDSPAAKMKLEALSNLKLNKEQRFERVFDSYVMQKPSLKTISQSKFYGASKISCVIKKSDITVNNQSIREVDEIASEVPLATSKVRVTSKPKIDQTSQMGKSRANLQSSYFNSGFELMNQSTPLPPKVNKPLNTSDNADNDTVNKSE